ncbi:uncharacterized protein LOC113776431 [Coffea eugenioides]|uniref:uncharacterized protein LOC113776431 n=1 Tax=Coffea eugenioides TaxID=49369 RepID=UPI000F6129FC|nr:uncharacterized protein LOC113776431 [Coffea eugenioides]
MERGWKPNVEISPACPRCGSSNTKFCYYNNYSLTQPRYFCKGCRRYWTKGGSLRNVPVGGGCRKGRRRNNRTFRDGATTIGIPLRAAVAGDGAVVSLGHINGTTTNPLILSESSTSSMHGCTFARAREEGSTDIDLALVYANFLNQKSAGAGAHEVDDQIHEGAAAEPHDRHRLEIPILMPPNNIAAVGVGGGSSFHQFSSVESLQMMDLMTNNNQLSQEPFAERGSVSDRSSDNHFGAGDAFYFSGLDSIERQQVATDYDHLTSCATTDTSNALNQINNYMLPPLPGEELSTAHSEGMVWSGCCDQELLFPSHKFHGNQSSSGLVESHVVQDRSNDQLDESRSPFNLSIELCNIFRP